MGLETNLLSSWDMDLAFERYREEEHTWWRRHQVDRPREYFVRPSGSLDAQVACHLFNPTFAVNNATFEETDDPSNPCIAQPHDAGFSSQNCLMFDHSARRDDSRRCSLIYPPDLWDVHERFISDLRSHMKAVVEVCWGRNVQDRMMICLQKNLRILPLWGRYDGINLHLELSEQMTSVKRFIVFVNHPQFYVFTKGDNVRAQAFRAEQGGRQDLLLELAAGLGKINISADFYKLNPLLLRPFRPTKTNREHMSALKGQAYTAIKAICPDAVDFSTIRGGLSIIRKNRKKKDKFNLPEVEPTSKNPAKVTGDMFEDDKALVGSSWISRLFLTLTLDMHRKRLVPSRFPRLQRRYMSSPPCLCLILCLKRSSISLTESNVAGLLRVSKHSRESYISGKSFPRTSLNWSRHKRDFESIGNPLLHAKRLRLLIAFFKVGTSRNASVSSDLHFPF